jgi:toxin secretion/phage lysis holin
MNVYKSIMTFLGGTVGYLLGQFDTTFKILLILVVIDYVSGVMAAAVEKNLQSSKGFQGIAKKVMLFLIVVVGALMDQTMGTGVVIRNATIFFYIANEILSIVENAGRIGLPIPKKIKDAIEVLQSKEEK